MSVRPAALLKLMAPIRLTALPRCRCAPDVGAHFFPYPGLIDCDDVLVFFADLRLVGL
jgi:hypothetical protein